MAESNLHYVQGAGVFTDDLIKKSRHPAIKRYETSQAS
jgi:hypothetical protein